MAKHTPGPWKIPRISWDYDLNTYVAVIVVGERNDIRRIVQAYSDDRLEAKANARLVAAAPQLLDAASDLIFELVEAAECPACLVDEGEAHRDDCPLDRLRNVVADVIGREWWMGDKGGEG